MTGNESDGISYASVCIIAFNVPRLVPSKRTAWQMQPWNQGQTVSQ